MADDKKKTVPGEMKKRIVPPTHRMDNGADGQAPNPTKRLDGSAPERGRAPESPHSPGPTHKMDAARNINAPSPSLDAESFIQPAALPPNTVLRGKYIIEQQIGLGGGQADLYLCRVMDSQNTKVVLKLYWGQMQPDVQVLKALKGVQHDDIIAFLDYGEANGRFFEVMEYAAGGTLSERLPSRPFNEKELTTTVIPEVINGLKYCHGKGIVHRDIKESNLYYRNADKTDVVLGDFGISSRLRGEESIHYTSRNFLTPVYAAPELYFGGGGADKVSVGPEIDYYALGITLIFLMNAPPFPGITELQHQQRLKLCNEVPLPENISDRFAHLLRGLLHPNPKSRWGGEKTSAWLRGEIVPLEPTQVVRFGGMEYKIGNETPQTLSELAKLLQDHPKEAIADIARGTLARAVDMFDVNLGREVAAIVESPGTPASRHIAIVHTLDPTRPYLLAPGVKAATPEELAKAIETSLATWNAGVEQLKNGNLLAWLRAIGHSDRAKLWEAHAKEIAAAGRDDVSLELFLMILNPKLAAPKLALSHNRFEVLCNDTKPQAVLDLVASNGGRGHLHGSVHLEGAVPGITVDVQRIDANRLRDVATTIRIAIDTTGWERGAWREGVLVLETNASGTNRTTIPIRARNAFPTHEVLRTTAGAAVSGLALAVMYRLLVASQGFPAWLNQYFGHYVGFKEVQNTMLKHHPEFAVLPVMVAGVITLICVVTQRQGSK